LTVRSPGAKPVGDGAPARAKGGASGPAPDGKNGGERTMSSVKLHGEGPHKVMCLHGWFGSSEGWGPMVDSLDGEAFSYAFPDYRGYGARRGESGSYTMAEIADDVLALADRLGWGRFSLLGHSMGGMAALRVLANAPGRVHKVVGVSPVPASGVPFDEPTWAFFRSAAESADARRGIIDLTTGKRLSRVWLDAMVRHSLAASTVEAFAAYLVAWAKTDFAAEIQGKPHPVLAVAGRHDPALGEEVLRGTYLTAFPAARLEVFENAGHYAMFETPVALATSIEAFLKE
jgi:pimeloyl-ACP methyl ester carboxylesterase